MKKGQQNYRWGGSTIGGPSTTRSLRSIDHSQKRQKNNKKNQKRSSKSQVGKLDHWGALDHSVPSIHRSFAEKAKKKQKKPKKVIKILNKKEPELGGPRPLGPFDPSIICSKDKIKLTKLNK